MSYCLYYNVLIDKYHNLYEGNGRDFFFSLQKKQHRRGKIPKVSKLSGERTVTGQNSGELYAKKHRRGNS